MKRDQEVYATRLKDLSLEKKGSEGCDGHVAEKDCCN